MTGISGARVEVIGGGIAGLTTALALAKQGASVCIYEQAPALTEVGAGIQITPNAARALRALGVWDACRTTGIAAQAVVPMDAFTGRAIARFDLSRKRPGYLFLHRAAVIDILADAARNAGVTIKLGQAMQAAQDQPDLLVGAEGLRSGLRARLNGAAAPGFTGQVAWRAIIATDAAPQAQIWMAPGRHVVTYPLPGGRLNIVAVQERAVWAAEGWNHPDDPANITSAFADNCPELLNILSQIKTANLWGLFRHPVAKHWIAPGVALVGDAAHPTLPFLAQGANLAIEDAFVLARTLAAKGMVTGLPAYEVLRRPRVIRAIEAANANARNYHLSGLQRRVAHTGLAVLGRVAPNAFLRRLSWLYDHDVTA